MIIAQLGRRDAPYIYFDVIDEERYSQTLDKHFEHTLLTHRLLVQRPHRDRRARSSSPSTARCPSGSGTFLSYVRFLFIAMHRDRFRDEVLAELLPPLEPDGTSHLWDALGRHFTGLTYAEADFSRRRTRSSSRASSPRAHLRVALPRDAQDVIGKVGAQTRGVEKLLGRIGFRYADRVDPFDGGPHFTAKTDEVTSHRPHASGQSRLDRRDDRQQKGARPLRERAHPVPLRARGLDVPTRAGRRLGRNPPEVASHLGLAVGDSVIILPLD